MAEERVLKTLLHVSDLHFGDKLGGPDLHRYDAQVEPYIRRRPWLDGLLGHHFDAVTDLFDLYDQELERHDPVLLVTGDLTRNGATRQFRRARLYLRLLCRSSLKSAPNGHGWPKYTIPGNHDHWPGRNTIIGRPATNISSMFSLPRVVPLTLDKARFLQLILINTDAEVHPLLRERVLARGRFKKQLRKARKLLDDLAASNQKGIRILLMHHSPSYPESKTLLGRQRIPGMLGIARSSRDELRRFLVDQEVAVVLTGHIHKPFVASHFTGDGDKRWTVWEARCGSTTCRDSWPISMKKPPRRRLDGNSLLVHQVVERDGLRWRTRLYERPQNKEPSATSAGSRKLGFVRVAENEILLKP